MTTNASPRGPLSEALLETLRQPPGRPLPSVESARHDPLADDDLQLALYLAYELHYRGLDGVSDGWEWDPNLLAFRARLEAEFLNALVGLVGPPSSTAPASGMDLALRAIAEADVAPSLSRYVEREASIAQVLEFVVHRSAYQLKEADPHSWALPRLHGAPKAALVEIQADEYGDGRPERIHAQLFANTMAALELDPTYGAYVDQIPGVTLATVNLMSFFGLHRRWRGALVGHLALFEMTSSVPNRRYARGLRRLGLDGSVVEFFDEHVEADAVHASIATVDLAGGLARQDAALIPDILWGAQTLVALEHRWAVHLLRAWSDGESSLLAPVPTTGAPA